MAEVEQTIGGEHEEDEAEQVIENEEAEENTEAEENAEAEENEVQEAATTEEAVAAAAEQAVAVVGGGGGGSGSEIKWPGWPGESVFRMLVPAQKVGGIIGRKGEFIKKLVEETRARIKILDGPPGTAERAVQCPNFKGNNSIIN